MTPIPAEPSPAGQPLSPTSPSETGHRRVGPAPPDTQPHSSSTPDTGPPIAVAAKGEPTLQRSTLQPSSLSHASPVNLGSWFRCRVTAFRLLPFGPTNLGSWVRRCRAAAFSLQPFAFGLSHATPVNIGCWVRCYRVTPFSLQPFPLPLPNPELPAPNPGISAPNPTPLRLLAGTPSRLAPPKSHKTCSGRLRSASVLGGSKTKPTGGV